MSGNDTLFHIGTDEPSDLDYRISDDGNSIILDAVDEALEIVQDFVNGKLSGYGCDSKNLFSIKLAIEEIFVNIISYAYRPDIGKAEVYCKVDENPLMVTIVFMDSGKPFDPIKHEFKDINEKMFIERPGGFGIHLVKNIMDYVDYEYKDGKNILRIKKHMNN